MERDLWLYGETRRQFDRQWAAIDDVAAKANALFAIGGVLLGLFSTAAFAGHSLLAWLGAVPAVGAAALLFRAYLCRDWMSPSVDWLEWRRKSGVDFRTTVGDATAALMAAYSQNDVKHKRACDAVNAAIALLASSVGLPALAVFARLIFPCVTV